MNDYMCTVDLMDYLQIMSRSRIHGSIHPLPHTFSLRTAELVKHREDFNGFNV
jgi:hypothetical protein